MAYYNGKKILGFVIGGGGIARELPTLFTPSIFVNSNGEIIITDERNGDFVSGYDIYMDDSLLATITGKIGNITDYIPIEELRNKIYKVRAKSENFNDSDFSNEYILMSWTEGLKYTLSSDGTYYLCSGIGDATETDIIIRDDYDGLPVKAINTNAFYYNDNVTSVTIPDSVTSIGSSAFNGCGELTSVRIGSNVKTIGNYAFYMCNKLRDITIPDSVTNIAYNAFDDCDRLESVTIGKGVKNIGTDAFYSYSIKRVNYTGDIKGWCDITFTNAYSNPVYYANGLYVNNELVTELIIPDGVTSIRKYAFMCCDSLTSVNIPNSVTSIGEDAFYLCGSLTEIVIPDSVTSIGDRGFWGKNVTSIVVSENNQNYKSENDALYNKDGSELILYACGKTANSFDIPSGVKTIKDSCFRGSNSLTRVTIPNSVTSIKKFAFGECDSLAEIVIPDSVTSIGEDAFYMSNGLRSITIPGSVTRLSNYMFYKCENLTSVIIEEGVETISESVFYYCNSLTSITIPNSLKTIGSYTFYGATPLEIIYGGTISQWNSITKRSSWRNRTIVVHCTDGDIQNA